MNLASDSHPIVAFVSDIAAPSQAVHQRPAGTVSQSRSLVVSLSASRKVLQSAPGIAWIDRVEEAFWWTCGALILALLSIPLLGL